MDKSTYQKLWAFVELQRSVLKDTRHQLIRRISMEQLLRISSKHGNFFRDKNTWKKLAYLDTFAHTAIGFIIFIAVVCAAPEVLNHPTRLEVFWVFMFIHLFLGFLAFVALFKDSSATLKIVLTGLIVLQLAVLGVTSNLKGECNSNPNDYTNAKAIVQSFSATNPQITEPSTYCQNLYFLMVQVVLPNFIHCMIFSAILITYLYKKAADVALGTSSGDDDPENETKKTFKFAHITVIIEEVV